VKLTIVKLKKRRFLSVTSRKNANPCFLLVFNMIYIIKNLDEGFE